MKTQIFLSRRGALIVTMALALAACASTPPPVASLESARQAVAQAERARAADTAALELSEARDKLAAANNAVKNENMLIAQRLADEARVLAELAFARAERADAQRVNAEIVEGTAILREEILRQAGGPR
ncbi:MAG TPA: DUF4398 domain-containing protein [Gammaproteobacteria bacterium]